MLSHLLIRDKFLEFDTSYDQEKQLQDKINYLLLNNEYSKELIEEINDNNYNLYEHEIKYKIFKDISSVCYKNNMIELVLDIPIDKNILSINKIKLSNKLNKYIKDIFVCVGDEKIITYRDFITINSESSTKFTKHIYSQKIINCQYEKKITLHLMLNNNIINKIINKNIFVNYSFTIFKNKLKFIQ
jgi:hypothetical protein